MRPPPAIAAGRALPLVMMVAFVALGIGWRSWMHWRRYGSTGFVFALYGYSGCDDPRCVADAHDKTCEIDHLIRGELGAFRAPSSSRSIFRVRSKIEVAREFDDSGAGTESVFCKASASEAANLARLPNPLPHRALDGVGSELARFSPHRNPAITPHGVILRHSPSSERTRVVDQLAG